MKYKGACLIALIVLIGIVFFVLLRVGVVKAPVLTALLYKAPAKVATVDLSDEEAQKAHASFERKLGEIAQQVATATEEKPVPIQVFVTQEELTGLFRSVARGQVTNAAVEINTSGVTMYGEVTQPLKGVLRLTVMPEVSEGALSFRIKDITIGGLPLPAGLGDVLLKKILKTKIDELNKTIHNAGKLKEIRLDPGVMILSAVVLDGKVFTQ